MSEVRHFSKAMLEAGLPQILESPADDGALKLIVARPDVDARKVIHNARLDTDEGLVGDNWLARGARHTTDGAADPEMQLNIMNARVIDRVAGSEDRWALAGDQLFVDMDLSRQNLPQGTQIALGDALIEITAPPHTGCRKFSARYGVDATVFVNSRHRKSLNLRGVCAKVVRSGDIEVGDTLRKVGKAARR